jgi:iron complex outermembrane receptor protein
MKLLCSILLLVLFFSISTFSQETVNDSLLLDEVIITGTPVKINRNSVPMAVSVVNNDQIAESDESALLPVLSGRVPGLFVTERGITGFGVAAGAAGQISIRGVGGNPTTGVLILIDGHPQFMGIFGHPLSDSYAASDVERVEVIRGPGSILYGSNSMGGVINIITKKQQEEGLHGSARAIYGSYNTLKGMVSCGYRKNKLSAFASVNHDETNGHRPHSDFILNNTYIKLGYELSNYLYANADLGIAGFKASDPGPDTAQAYRGQSIDITRGYWSVSLNNHYEKLSGSAKFFYNFGEHNVTDGFYSKDANYGVTLFEALKLFKGNSITIGSDYMNYGGKAKNENLSIVFKDTAIYDAGIYGFVQQTLFNRLLINAGLRLQQNEVYGSELIPSAGFAYKFSNVVSWKVNFSKGFRSPTIRELYMWNHNPDLSPERVFNYETGIAAYFLKKTLAIDATVYVIKGDNLIVSGQMGRLSNSGIFENKGIEVSIKANPYKNLFYNAVYSFIDMKDPVYATPRHHFYVSGHYTLKNLLAMVNLQYVSGLDTDPSAIVHTNENYTLLNAKISYNFLKKIGLFISAENLLNERYETNRFYTMPRNTFFCGVNFKF